MTKIVVGVDGSSHSRRALRRGIEEARLRNGEVEAVYVFPLPPRSLLDDLVSLPSGANTAFGASSIETDGPAHHPPSPDDLAVEQAQRELSQIVEEVLAQTDGPAPRLSVIPNSHPAEALIAASWSADLLVIGTRGFGGFAGMLLGSVAHQCIQRARCPLLILPPTD